MELLLCFRKQKWVLRWKWVLVSGSQKTTEQIVEELRALLRLVPVRHVRRTYEVSNLTIVAGATKIDRRWIQGKTIPLRADFAFTILAA